MNKLFNFAQAKGKWHKFPSFDLGGGAKLYKNFAQKLLAVSLCMAVVLLGTPVTTFADDPGFSIDTETGYITSVSNAGSLTTITIPKQVGTTDVKGVNQGVFDGCTSLATFAVEDGHQYLSVGSSGELLGRADTTGDFNILYRLPPAFAGEYKLPDTVTEIKDGAFTNCSKLTTFNLGSGSSAITWTDFSFAGCSSLAAFAGRRGTLCSSFSGDAFPLLGRIASDYLVCLAVAPAAVGPYAVKSGYESGWSFSVCALQFAPSASWLLLQSPDLLMGTTSQFGGMHGAPVLVPAESVSSLTLGSDPASVLGYEVDTKDPYRLIITSRKGNTEPRSLACDTFIGYKLAVEDAEEIQNLTIKHAEFDESHKCTACGATIPVEPVTGVTLSATTKSLKVDETFELTATVTPENATDSALTWTVDNPATASFKTPSGLVDSFTTLSGAPQTFTVQGLKAGTAEITVTTKDGGFSKTCTVTVTQPVTDVTLSEATKSLAVSESFTLTAEVSPPGATNKNVTWTSSNETVATVNAVGVVTAVAPGTATITATASDGSGVSASCAVTVTQPVEDEAPVVEDPDLLTPDDRSSWGTPYVREADGVTQYVVEDPTSPDFGMTSVEFTTASLSPAGADSPMFWVHESSGGSSAWYGILADHVAHLGPGYRFYVQWLSPGDPGYDVLFDRLNDEDKQRVEDDNGWLFNMGVRAPDGTDVHYLVTDEVVKQPIVYVQIGDDWDVDDLNAYYLAVGGNEKVPVDYLMIDYPEGTDTFGRMTLDHFSPYFIFDELNAEELAALKNNQNQTGDLATQLLISGLSIVLVSSLGVMLRLITNKRKFEE